mgnify:CR=1 FL=1
MKIKSNFYSLPSCFTIVTFICSADQIKSGDTNRALSHSHEKVFYEKRREDFWLLDFFFARIFIVLSVTLNSAKLLFMLLQ